MIAIHQGEYTVNKQPDRQYAMAPRQKETVIYYDFGDVLESASASFSSRDFAKRCQSMGPRIPKHLKKYENVKHVWEDKTFAVVRSKPALFQRQQKIDNMVQRQKARLVKAGCWSDDSLVLMDESGLFRNKSLLEVKNPSKLPKGMKVELLSGKWVSKVFLGDEREMLNWVSNEFASFGQAASNSLDWFTVHPSDPSDGCAKVVLMRVP